MASGLFDDLVPEGPAAAGGAGLFDDLVPSGADFSSVLGSVSTTEVPPARPAVPNAPLGGPQQRLPLGEALMERGKAGVTGIVGGGLRALGESLSAPFDALQDTVLGPLLTQASAPQRAVADVGTELGDLATAQRDLGLRGVTAPDSLGAAIDDPGNTARYYGGIAAESLPLMAAAIATRRPGLAVGVTGTGAGAAEYGQAREGGLTQEQALGQAISSGLIEAGLSQLPLDEALGGLPLGRRLMTVPAAEAATEALTESAQYALPAAMQGGEFDRGEMNRAMLDAAIVGGGLGLGEAVAGRNIDDPGPRAARPNSPEALVEPSDPAAELGAEPMPPQAVPPQAPAATAPLGDIEALARNLLGDDVAAELGLDPEPAPAPPAEGVADLLGNITPEQAEAALAALGDLTPAASPESPTPPAPASPPAGDVRATPTTVPTVQPPADTVGSRPAGGDLVPAAAPEPATRRPARKPFYEMTADEISAQAESSRTIGREIEDRIFGPRADEYRKAASQANSSDPKRASAGYAKQEEFEQSITESERNELFGIGEDGDVFDDVPDYRRAMEDADVANEQEAGERLGFYLSKIGRTEGQDPSKWSRGEQVAYAALGAIRDRIAERGWDSSAIQRAAVQRAAGRFSDPEDAVFMLERFMPKAAPARAPSESAIEDDTPDPPLNIRYGKPRVPTRRIEAPRAAEAAPEAAELSDADLTPAERSSLRRQQEAADPKVAESQRKGAADAERFGIREAIDSALGETGVRVEYLSDATGLPERLRTGVQRRLEQRGGRGQTAALYDQRDNRVFLFTDVATTPDQAVFHAAHEIAGHHGLRALLGDALNPALEISLQNPTVKALADKIAAERKFKPGQRLLSAEEALAELAAAVRTGDYDQIASRYGVDVPQGIRASVARAIENFLRRLKALFGKNGQTFTDEQVRELLEAAWQAAKGDATTQSDPEVLEAVDAGDTRLPATGPRLAPDDVRRADRREAADPNIIERAKRDVQDQIDGFRKMGRGRPKNPETLRRRANALRSWMFDSVVSRARALERRNPESKALRKLFNQVFTAPGDSRLVVETVHEATESAFAKFTNRVRNILDNEGMERLTDKQNDQLRAALLRTEKNLPAPIERAARRIRKLMDNAREDLIAAGVEIGEVEDIGYLTRLYDTPKILADEAGFLRAAERYYRTEGFAQEVGRTPQDVLAGESNMARFLATAKRAATGDEKVAAAIQEIRDLVRATRRAGDLEQNAKAIEGVVSNVYGRVADQFATYSAAAWLHRTKTPTVGEVFNGVGPSGAPLTKERVLTGAADTIMAEYLNTDVLDILETYARTTSKKLAMAARFGPKGEKVQELIDSASREGVPARDLQEATELMESALGNYSPINPRGKTALDVVQAWTYLGLLSRVTFSSMAEGITFALRTGNVAHAAAPLVQVYRAALKTEKGKDLRDMALMVGVNGNQAMEEVMQNQLGGDYGMEPKWSKLIHRFMSGVGLMQLTRAQRAYGVGAATGYLRWIAKNVAAGKRTKEMSVYLNELGIADHQAFAEWMVAQGTLPDSNELHDENGRPTPRGQDYMVAVRRFVDQSIQNPTAAHRPSWMNSPLGRVAGSITGFSYAAYENILKREARLAKTLAQEAGTGTASRRLAAFMGGAMALALGQTVVSTVRELLFNAARFEDKDDEEIAKEMVMLGLNRTFGFGSGDPIIQYLTGLKYSRSIGETFLGASIGTLAQRIDAGAAVFTDRNSPNTDTTEYRAMEALYSGVITPVANAALSRIPIPLASAVAIPAASDRRLRDQFAGLFFDQPERETEADRAYRAVTKDLADIQDTVRDTLALKPDDQWEAELEALKAEYAPLLDGVTLNLYKRGSKDGRFGPGDAKRDAQGKPRLKLEDEGKGSVLGELEGYPYKYSLGGRLKEDTTEGIEDRIKALNKAIKLLRDGEDLTRGNLVEITKGVTADLPKATELSASLGGMRPGATTTGEATKLAGRRLEREILEELQEARRSEKRRAVEIVERAKRGEPIERK